MVGSTDAAGVPANRHGILYPQRLPEFTRLAPPPRLAHVVHWFWVPEWSLSNEQELRQEILPYPACNLVVETGAMSLVGPPTRRSERVLRGSGWAVGALLRPAGAAAIHSKLRAIRDCTITLDAPTLVTEVSMYMRAPRTGGEHRQHAVTALSRWLVAHLRRATPNREDLLANQLGEVIADPTITRVDQLAPRLHISIRTLHRMAERYFGLSLHSMIRRRRVQEAADRLRSDPTARISAIASELGYSDHAHFTTEFKSVIGVPPSAYRQTAQSVDPHSR